MRWWNSGNQQPTRCCLRCSEAARSYSKWNQFIFSATIYIHSYSVLLVGSRSRDLGEFSSSYTGFLAACPGCRSPPALRTVFALNRVAMASLAASFFCLCNSADASLIDEVITPMNRFKSRNDVSSMNSETARNPLDQKTVPTQPQEELVTVCSNSQYTTAVIPNASGSQCSPPVLSP